MKTRTNDLVAFCLFIAFVGMYLCTTLTTFSYDGLCYALDVEFGPPTNLFHANHVLYGFLMRQLWHGAGLLGFSGRAIYLMQAVNLCAAAAAVGLLYRITVSAIGRAPAALSAVAMGTSHALWINASDPGCYGLVTFAATLLLAVFFKRNVWPPFGVGFLQGGLVLIHQLLLIPAVAFLADRKKEIDGSSHRSWCAQYIGGLMASGGIFYIAVGWYFHGPRFGAVLYWLTHPADAIWSPPGTQFWNFQLIDQIKTAVSGMTQSIFAWPASPVCGVLLWLTALLCGVAAFRDHVLPRALWYWLGVLWLFQLFYFPGALTYRLLSWPPFFALAFSSRAVRRRAAQCVLGVLVLLSAVHNGQAAWALHRAIPQDQARTAWVRSMIGPHDFFLFAGRGSASVQNVYLAYFAPRVPAHSLYGYLFGQTSGNLEPLQTQLRSIEAHGGRIFIEGSLRNPEVLAFLEAPHHLSSGILQQGLLHWRTVKHYEGPGGYSLDQSVFDFQAK